LLAEEELLNGRPEQARALTEPLGHEVLEAAISCDYPMPAAQLYTETGAEAEAEALLARATAHAIVQDNWLQLVNIARGYALLAERRTHFDEAQRRVEEALALCQRMPYPYGEAKTLFEYGRMLTRRRRCVEAREKYQAALAICERLGEGLYRPHIERALAQL
jgi:hypothetical protein